MWSLLAGRSGAVVLASCGDMPAASDWRKEGGGICEKGKEVGCHAREGGGVGDEARLDLMEGRKQGREKYGRMCSVCMTSDLPEDDFKPIRLKMIVPRKRRGWRVGRLICPRGS
ncbi:hypothetical protein CBR_g6298 [Chara braunii]|uniref:Uncharacterized protein n=1 Tax=Chara braunii TaxID=69332 RepID=A0A388KJF8_CHABU|nr:hypothetical protein CBR_g6298 [Chara braunii]|eukprot:GBG70167.1 hypothetical protein CBR_g6298 [Chara braunii]